MESRTFINKIKPKLIENWSHQASLFSYADVAELCEMYSNFEKEKLELELKTAKETNRQLQLELKKFKENQEINK